MSFYQDRIPNGELVKKSAGIDKSVFLWWAAFVIFVLMCVTFWYIMKEYNRKTVCIADIKADYQVAAASLISEFETNSGEADKKYEGRVILVEGIVKKIEVKDNAYALSVGSPVSSVSVLCSLDSTQQIGTLTDGKPALIKGVYIGYNQDELLGSDVILNRCVLENRKK